MPVIAHVVFFVLKTVQCSRHVVDISVVAQMQMPMVFH